MFKMSRENSYYIILFALIFSLVGGSVLFDFTLFGVHFYGFRLVVIIGIIYLLITKQLVLYENRFERLVFYFLLLWMVTAIFSILWTPEKLAGFHELIYIALGVGTYFLLLSLSKKIQSFQANFVSIWKFLFWVLAVFCFNEILTKFHLASSFTESIEKFGVAHKINSVPTFSFDNPNHLAVYLVLTIAVLAHYFLNEGNFYKLYLPFLVISVFLILIESKLASLSLLSMVLLIGLFQIQRLNSWFKHSSPIKIISSIVFLTFTLSFLFLFNKRIDSNSNSDKHLVLVDQKIADSLRNLGAKHTPSPDVVLFMPQNTLAQIQESKVSMNFTYSKIKKQGSFWQQNYWLLPLSTFIILLLTGVLLFFIQNGGWKQFVVISASGLLMFAGVFSKHDLIRVNEKWLNHAIIQSNSPKENTFIHGELNLTPVSVQHETAAAFQKGERLSLVALDPKDALIQQSQSALIRKKLYLKGWDYLKSSQFLGAGAGSFAVLAAREKKMDNLTVVTSPHSLFIEIFVQYGLVIGLIFLVILMYPILLLLKQFFNRQFSSNSLLLSLVLICFVVMSHSNSASLPLPVIWVNFSLVVILSGNLLSSAKKQV